MLEIIVYGLFCFLAAYGLVTLLKSFLWASRREKVMKTDGIQLVLLVKNREDDIEGIVKNLIDTDFKARIMSDRDLKVVDLSSQDNTLAILQKLKNDYDNLDIIRTHSEEYKQLSSILTNWVM